MADKDYSGTPLSQKLGAKPGAGVVVFFTTSRAALESRFAALKGTLDPADGLWIAWPKKAAKLETDLSFEAVQADRPGRRARRQQELLDRRALAGAPLRLPARGPSGLRRRPSRARCQRGSSRRIGSGSRPRSSARSSVSSWKRTMSTTGCRVGTSVTSQPRISSAATASRARSAARPSPSSTKQRTCSSIAARCPCRSSSVRCASAASVGAFAQLQRRLLRGRPVAAGAGDQPALVRRDGEPLGRELCGDRVGSQRDVLAAQRGERRDGARVARRVAVALLEPWGADDDLVAQRCERALRLPGHEPLRPGEGARRLDGQRRPALVADEDEQVGLGRCEHRLERLDAVARGLGGVERRAAADGGVAPGRQPAIGGHSGEPVGLREDRRPHLRSAVPSATRPSIPCGRWRSSTASRSPNGLRVLTAPMPHAQSVSCVVMLAAGSRYETAETNGIAHFAEHMFFKGTERRPTARDLVERDRRDRRRVQRLHRQGVHGLLRPLRGRDARHRARRARRHAPQLPLRPGGDRAREGRDHRGDEHVLRHAARLHRRRVRGAPLRRPAARLGHHRPQGDGPRRDARDVHRVPRPLVPARPHGRRGRRPDRRRPARAARGAARRPRAARDRRPAAGRPRRERLAREGAHEGSPTRRTSCSACAAGRSWIRTGTCSSCSRPCSAAACRRGSSPRCASAAGSATTSSARTTPTPTRARSTRSRASTSTGSTTR